MAHTVLAGIPTDDTADCLPQDAGLRAALEQIRLLAAQSRLLALNTVIESAGAPEAQAMAAEAEQVASTVELLLQQLQSNYAISSIVTGPRA